MGGTASKQLKQQKITIFWKKIGNENGIDIYQHLTNGNIAQKRTIMIDPIYSIDNEAEMYRYRKYNNYGLVQVYQIEDFTIEDSIKKIKSSIGQTCSVQHKLNVLTQKMEFRLSQLPQLTFAESLHILNEAASSYQVVYNKIGPCHINSELIGINFKGQTKVWVNQNWALNHPSHSIHILKSTKSYANDYEMIHPHLRDEKEMIQNLIKVVQTKTEEGKYPVQFNQSLIQHSTNFKQLKKFLNSYINYATEQYLPNLIKRSRVLVSTDQSNKYQQHKSKTTTKNQSPLIVNKLNACVPTNYATNYKTNYTSNQFSTYTPSVPIYATKVIETKYTGKEPVRMNNVSSNSSINSKPQFHYSNSNQKIIINSSHHEYELTFGKPNTIQNFDHQKSAKTQDSRYKFMSSGSKPAQILHFQPKPFNQLMGGHHLSYQYSANKPSDSINHLTNINLGHIDNKTLSLENILPSTYKPINFNEVFGTFEHQQQNIHKAQYLILPEINVKTQQKQSLINSKGIRAFSSTNVHQLINKNA